MIKKVIVTNHLGESLTILMGNSEGSGFLITSIDGLDPGKADINMTDIMTSDGAVYGSSRLPKRNIILILALDENPTIEKSRLNTYKYFPIQKIVTLEIETDNRHCKISGKVESNQITIFSKQETATLSILCASAYFSTIEQNVTKFSGITSEFEFPFSNESLSESLLVMGNITSYADGVITYSGDADTGVIISMHAIGEVINPKIINQTTNQSMTINTTVLEQLTGDGIISGDDIIIDTIKGEKSVTLVRAGEFYNIFNCLEKNTDWIELNTGDNVFAYLADEGTANLQLTIYNSVLYEGI